MLFPFHPQCALLSCCALILNPACPVLNPAGKCAIPWAVGAAPGLMSSGMDPTSPSAPTTGKPPAQLCTVSPVPCRTVAPAVSESQVREGPSCWHMPIATYR